MKKKLTALALVLAVVASLFAGMTLTYFTDKGTVTNTFTVGNVDIKVYETDANGQETEAGRLYENVVPGVTYAKDPTIKNIGRNGAYARMLVTVPKDLFNTIASLTPRVNLEDVFLGFDSTKWELGGIYSDDADTGATNAITYVYNYRNVLGAGDTATLFTGFELPAGLTQEDLAAWSTFYIAVEGQAIQKEGFTDGDAALRALDDAYDHKATVVELASTQEELNNVIAAIPANSEEPTKVALPAGDFKLETGTAQNKNVTIIGTKDTVVKVLNNNGMSYQNGANLSFEGVTIKGQTSGDFGGIAHVEETTYTNCTFEGKLTLYGDATFTNCTFNNSSDYAIWTWGAQNAKFVGCTFNSGGKALLLYGGAGSSANPTTKLTVTDCVFNDDGTLSTEKAAIETGNDYGATYELTVNNVTVNGFAVNPEGISTGTSIWANKKSMDRDHLNVVIDGVDVY